MVQLVELKDELGMLEELKDELDKLDELKDELLNWVMSWESWMSK